MGSRAVVIVCRDEAGGAGAVRRHDGRSRHRLHPHRPAVLQRPGPGAAVPRPGAGGSDRRRPLGQAGDDLGLPRLRADAVVGQGPGTPADPVRGGRGRGLGLAAPGGGRAGAGRGAAGRRRAGDSSSEIDGRLPPPGAGRRPVRRRLPAVLLAGRLADRPEAGPVPPAGHRGARPHGQGSRLAHGDTWPRSAGPTPSCCWRPRTRSWT